jgi:hypothetical protein
MGYDVDALALARALPVSGLGSTDMGQLSVHHHVWPRSLEPRAAQSTGAMRTGHESSLSWLVLSPGVKSSRLI